MPSSSLHPEAPPRTRAGRTPDRAATADVARRGFPPYLPPFPPERKTARSGPEPDRRGLRRRHRTKRAAGASAALLLLLAVVVPLATPAASELPEQFEATFVLEAAGATIARAQWSLAPGAAGTYVATSRTDAAGVFALIRDETRVERSRWTWEGEWLQPLEYRYERTGRKSREIDIVFDWEANVARHDSPGASWRLPVPPGTMDKFNYILAMMHDLGRGQRRVEYTIADGGRRLKRYVLAGIGKERVETALGVLDTVVMQRKREHSARKTTFWCAEALGFLPVKIVHEEGDGQSMTLHIESLSGIRRPGS